MTPYEIGVLMHYYCSNMEHHQERNQPPIWPGTIAQFVHDGLLLPKYKLHEEDAMYEITPRGRAFVDSLQRVPLPEQMWVTPWPKES